MAPPSDSASHPFYIEEDGTLVGVSAGDLVSRLESGQSTLEDQVRVRPTRPAKPVRTYLRELIWMAERENEVNTATDAATPELGPYRVAFAHAPVGMVISDLGGAVLHANSTFADLVGRPAEALVGLLVGDLSSTGDRRLEVEQGNRLLRGEIAHFQIEKLFHRPDGTAVPCLVSLSLVRTTDGQPRFAVAVVVDLRERRQLEQLHATMAETAAMQRLARGVAHDFNNLLSVVTTSVALIRECDPAEFEDNLDAITQASTLGIHLSRQLNALSVVGDRPAQRLDLCEAVRSRAPFLQRIVLSGQQLLLELGKEPVWIDVAPTDLDQILLNIIVNAAQASPSTGTIRITLLSVGEHVTLSVHDNGCGMSTEVLERFLEPNFSRRPGGTGLGMSIVSAALVRADGALTATSTEGEGTTIHLLFPTCVEPDSEAIA